MILQKLPEYVGRLVSVLVFTTLTYFQVWAALSL